MQDQLQEGRTYRACHPCHVVLWRKEPQGTLHSPMP